MSRFLHRLIGIVVLSFVLFSFAACQITTTSSSTTTTQTPQYFLAPTVIDFRLDTDCATLNVGHDQSSISGDLFGIQDAGNVAHRIKDFHRLTLLPPRDAFVDINTDCTLLIELHNPDELVIESVTISDIVYTVNSRLTRIEIPFSSGIASEIQILELQDIRFQYANRFGNVVFANNPILRVGVISRDIPSIQQSNLVTTSTSIQLTAQVFDPAGAALFQNALLYNPILNTFLIQELSVGQNTVLFEDLEPNTEYQLVLYSGYDPYAYRELYYVFQHVMLVTTEMIDS